jgi:hypothetical protein
MSWHTHTVVCFWYMCHKPMFRIAQTLFDHHSALVSNHHTFHISSPPYHLQYLFLTGPHMAPPDLCHILLTTGSPPVPLSVRPIPILISSVSVLLASCGSERNEPYIGIFMVGIWKRVVEILAQVLWVWVSERVNEWVSEWVSEWVCVCVCVCLPLRCFTNDCGIFQRQNFWACSSVYINPSTCRQILCQVIFF